MQLRYAASHVQHMQKAMEQSCIGGIAPPSERIESSQTLAHFMTMKCPRPYGQRPSWPVVVRLIGSYRRTDRRGAIRPGRSSIRDSRALSVLIAPLHSVVEPL